MPATTRSKRKSTELNDTTVRTKRCSVKLVDITNIIKNNSSTGKTVKDEAVLQKCSDNIKLYTKIQINKDEQLKCNQPSHTMKIFENAVNTMKKVKIILQNKFQNAVDRLQLDIIPECLYDIKKCRKIHTSAVPHKSTEEMFMANLYITEERHFLFIQHINRNMISKNIFPGTELCIKILKEIMIFNSKDSCASTCYVLTELHHTFITILCKFPPCHIRNLYLRIFRSPIKLDGLPETTDILSTLLDLLHDFINGCETKEFQRSDRNNFNTNFYLWDVQHNNTFTSLSRSDQIDRLFMILDLLIRTLEYDMSISVIKYSHRFASLINDKDENNKPIIYSVIWKGCSVAVNSLVKKIILIFINMNAIKYPPDKIMIISRLLNLIANFMNMYEYPDNGTQYPIYRNLTLDLINEVQKNIENSIHYSIDLWLSIMDNVRSPLLKVLLANHLYSKIVNRTVALSLSNPLQAIHNNDFLKFKEAEKRLISSVKSERYPVYSRNDKYTINKLDITQYEIIKLMMIYTDAMIKYFHLSEIFNEIKKPEAKISDHELRRHVKVNNFDDFESNIKCIDLNEKINLRSIDLNFKSNINIQLTKENCTFYRDEIKNFKAIIKLVKNCREKFGVLFDEWFDNINKKIDF